MTRFVLLCAFMLAGAAASLAQTLPVPPVPPRNPPRDQAAPVPDPDIRQPMDLSSAEIRVRPDVFPARRPDPSQGFAPGSRYQPADERNPLQTPGVRLTVPLR